MQGILVFASEAARDAAITSPQEGQFAFTKDNNSLWYYDSVAWVASGATGDIEGVTAGTGISGGGTSGTVTITNSMATEIDAKGDLVVGTGADTFARLAVGANGTVLTAASGEATGLEWAAAAGGGTNWTLLNAGGTALTGATDITVSGISGVNKIMILVGGASSVNTGASFRIRLNGDTGNNYDCTDIQLSAAAAYTPNQLIGINNLGGNSRIELGTMSGVATSTVSGYVMLDACNTTGIKSFTAAGAGSATASNAQRGFISGGYYDSASTISSVTINSSSGNFDAGTIFVYTSA
jgi:hypothetical protein